MISQSTIFFEAGKWPNHFRTVLTLSFAISQNYYASYVELLQKEKPSIPLNTIQELFIRWDLGPCFRKEEWWIQRSLGRGGNKTQGLNYGWTLEVVLEKKFKFLSFSLSALFFNGEIHSLRHCRQVSKHRLLTPFFGCDVMTAYRGWLHVIRKFDMIKTQAG